MPPVNTLVGTWQLVQIWTYSSATDTVLQEDDPSTPAQTVRFTSAGEVSAMNLQDTTLTKARYYVLTYGDLVGPQLVLRETKESVYANSLKYLVEETGTLSLSPISSGRQLKFIKLQ